MRVSSEHLLDDVYGHDEQLLVGPQIAKLPSFGEVTPAVRAKSGARLVS
jgi:hypothetical protein